MLRSLRLTAALSVALATSLPGVAFAIPVYGNINVGTVQSSGGLVINPIGIGGIGGIGGSQTVIVNPVQRSRTVVYDPLTGSQTVIVDPTYSQSGVVYDPYQSSQTVIVNGGRRSSQTVIINNPPNNIYQYPYYQQPSCGSMVYGSPIASPMPVNPYTGRMCR